jgi:hypothetical protein
VTLQRLGVEAAATSDEVGYRVFIQTGQAILQRPAGADANTDRSDRRPGTGQSARGGRALYRLDRLTKMATLIGGGTVLAIRLVLTALLLSGPADDRRLEAQAAVRRGNEALRAGLSDAAIRAYVEALEIYPSAKIYYNLGQAYRSAGRPAEALAALERFVTEGDGVDSHAPDDELRARVATARRWIAELEEELAGRQEPSPRAPVPPALAVKDPGPAAIAAVPAAPPPRRSRRAVWLLIGLGAVGTAAAAFFLLSAQQRTICPAGADLGCY